MAVGIHVTLPEGVSVDEYRAVDAALEHETNPIDGLIFHQGVEMEGRVHGYDVWESREKFDTFQQERLGPAIAATVGEERLAEVGPPRTEEYEVLNYVKGA